MALRFKIFDQICRDGTLVLDHEHTARRCGRQRTRQTIRRHKLYALTLGLAAEFAQVTDYALRAFRLARDAGIAAMQDQPMMGIAFEFFGCKFLQPALDFEHISARSEPYAVRDAENVGID